jgi:AmmeMemoRadiSam system protein B/AmmeMemoRadiSam system protein A
MIEQFKKIRAGWMGMTLCMVGCHRGSLEATASSDVASSAEPVRPPAVAGQFYPGQSAALRRAVKEALRQVEGEVPAGQPVALLAPHAGYVYSAGVAAYGYRAVAGRRITDVVLIGNSHHFPLRKGAVYARGTFVTPLGRVPVNAGLADAILQESSLLETNDAPHGPEHSLEVQLPFLQELFPEVQIVPILLGSFPARQCRSIGEGIGRAIQKTGRADTTLIISSSDMSHYPTGDNADRVDRAALQALESFDEGVLAADIEKFMSAGIPNLHCVFCGEESVLTTLAAARTLGADAVKILHYANSGDVTGERDRVVGYGSAVFLKVGKKSTVSTKKDGPTSAVNASSKPFAVSPSHQVFLLNVARESIAYYLDKGQKKTFATHDPELLTPAAVFVTLTQRGELRGCIGILEARASLLETVADFAVAAAVEDNRFQPVTARELPGLRIEISVLSPMERVSSADLIQPQVHGVLVRRGRYQGLFLPQVWEHFDRKEDFMDELCRQKAHLEARAWQDPATELYTFTVFAFEEPAK